MIFEPLSRDLVESREIPARRGQRVPVARRRASARNLERLRVGSWAGGHGRIREWGQAFYWLFGNSRGRHSTDILSEFRISGQVKMYALK